MKAWTCPCVKWDYVMHWSNLGQIRLLMPPTTCNSYRCQQESNSGLWGYSPACSPVSYYLLLLALFNVELVINVMNVRHRCTRRKECSWLLCISALIDSSLWPSGSGVGLAINRPRVRIPAAALLSATLEKLFARVPLSPCSIIWYQPMGSDARQLGR